MAQPKVQLVAPIGNINLPGMTATGVVTATSLSGIATGSVTNLTGSPDLDVGIVTGSSFVGDGTGHAASLTGTPNLNLGLTTATSFIGDAVGKAAGLTGTPNLNVGLITGTSFVGFVTGDVTGNISGLAASVTPGVNLGLGVCTAIQYHGDGSNLTGAGSSAWIAQEITATSAETIIDLSDGNTIYYKGGKTTVGFASTSAAEQITIIRDPSPTFTAAYNESFSTGGVTFDGNDYLSMADNAAFQLGTDDWTIEFFWKSDSGNTGNYQQLIGTQTNDTGTTAGIWRVGTRTGSNQIYFSRADGSGFEEPIWDVDVNDEAWHHIAFTRESGSVYCYVDGQKQTNVGESNAISGTMTTSNPCYIGYNTRDGTYITGTVSSARIVKGTAVYVDTFLPPSAELTNVTNTVLLCCQSNSSTTATTVSAGTITANGDPAAGAETVAYSGTNTFDSSGVITWPSTVKWYNDTTPTLIESSSSSAFQIFHFTTVDTGASYQAWEEMKSSVTWGTLWAWGYNATGQLGQNATIQLSSPVQIPGTWDQVSRAGGYGWATGIKGDGTLWTWGYNNQGQLAQNDTTQYSSPTQVGTNTNWSTVRNGYSSCVAVKTDGTYWSWGYNYYGELGHNTNQYPARRSSPTQVPGSNWSDAGNLDTSSRWSLKTNGTLWVAGKNNYGVLGLNNQGNPTAVSSPTQLPGTTWSNNIIAHSNAGGVNAIKTDGTLWGWGSQGSGQIGLNGPHPGAQSSPVQIPGTTWKQVASHRGGGVATKTDGSLWAWGSAGDGQLGQNNKTARSSPTQVGTDTTWDRCFAVGQDAAGATKTDGTIWTWGKNPGGQLGQNNETSYSSPTQIPGTSWYATGVRNAAPGTNPGGGFVKQT